MIRFAARGRIVLGVGAAALLAIVIGVAIGFALTRGQAAQTPRVSANPVEGTTRVVPASIADLPLLGPNGQRTDLAAMHGRYVILADFMTSCQEECPITTGALLSVQEALQSAHLTGQVRIVEVSVDAARDTPSRFRAYARRFGVPWELLTGRAGDLHRLWSWFGAYYYRVPEGKPPSINWQTGRPYTYDIVHSDDAIVLGPRGNERALVAGNANVAGHLSKALKGLLDSQGVKEFVHPGYGSWSPTDLLDEVGILVGRRIPLAPSSN